MSNDHIAFKYQKYPLLPMSALICIPSIRPCPSLYASSVFLPIILQLRFFSIMLTASSQLVPYGVRMYMPNQMSVLGIRIGYMKKSSIIIRIPATMLYAMLPFLFSILPLPLISKKYLLRFLRHTCGFHRNYFVAQTIFMTISIIVTNYNKTNSRSYLILFNFLLTQFKLLPKHCSIK